MKTNYTAAAALAGGLLIFALMQGTASSASLPILNSPHSGVTLVGHGGGGGGGGGGNGGGGGGGGGHGGGGGPAMAHAGGMSAMAHSGGMGGSNTHAMTHNGGMGGGRNMHAGAMAHNGGMGRQHFAEGPHGNHFDRSDHDRFVARQDHSHKRFAERDFDHGRDFNHGHRHRVFRNGVWVWAYGPDYYAYDDDCYWLLQRARYTGSGYWWSRYNACVGYY